MNRSITPCKLKVIDTNHNMIPFISDKLLDIKEDAEQFSDYECPEFENECKINQLIDLSFLIRNSKNQDFNKKLSSPIMNDKNAKKLKKYLRNNFTKQELLELIFKYVSFTRRKNILLRDNNGKFMKKPISTDTFNNNSAKINTNLNNPESSTSNPLTNKQSNFSTPVKKFESKAIKDLQSTIEKEKQKNVKKLKDVHHKIIGRPQIVSNPDQVKVKKQIQGNAKEVPPIITKQQLQIQQGSPLLEESEICKKGSSTSNLDNTLLLNEIMQPGNMDDLSRILPINLICEEQAELNNWNIAGLINEQNNFQISNFDFSKAQYQQQCFAEGQSIEEILNSTHDFNNIITKLEIYLPPDQITYIRGACESGIPQKILLLKGKFKNYFLKIISKNKYYIKQTTELTN
jgi:hypothetical protein